MGYIENVLPRYLSSLGADVHVITLGLPPHGNQKSTGSYEGFAATLPVGVERTNAGYMLHVIPHRRTTGYMRAVGLQATLASLRPDIVQTTAAIGWIPLQAAVGKLRLRYKLFTGNHYHSSVFPLASKNLPFWHKEVLECRITRWLPGRLVGLHTEKCYAIAPDCADIATRFFGVPKNKVEICPLGVDTELFTPVERDKDNYESRKLRCKLGFLESDIVCIFTGRFTDDKNPLLLARAVAKLKMEGRKFRALFVGNGPQLAAIRSTDGCVVQPFVPVHELPSLFRAADIGVWPTQESTSMLDGAACGLPIIANDTMSDPERLRGNGISYRLNDVDDLMRALLALESAGARRQMGQSGSQKMLRMYSWQSIAERRIRDYTSILGVEKASSENSQIPEADLAND